MKKKEKKKKKKNSVQRINFMVMTKNVGFFESREFIVQLNNL